MRVTRNLLLAVLAAGLSLPAAAPAARAGSGAGAGALIVSGDDGKAARVDGAYIVDPHRVPDAFVVLDAGSFPPHIIGETTVHHSVSAPPSAVALAPSGQLALLAAPDRIDAQKPGGFAPESFLQVIAIREGRPHVMKHIALPHQPVSVAINAAGTLALTVEKQGEVSVFDIRGRDVELRKTLVIGGPKAVSSALAITPDGRWALVTFRGEDQLGVLPIAGGKVSPPAYRIATGHNPYGIAIAADGRFAVVANVSHAKHKTHDSVTLIDLTAQPFRATAEINVPPNAEGIAISPDSRWVAVSCIAGSNERRTSPSYRDHGVLALFRAANGTLQLLGTAPTGHNSQGVIFTPDSRHILVQDYVEHAISLFDVSTHGPIATRSPIAMPGGPASIAAAPN
jgi:Lactonase, 7-bladed beta-propeller